MEYVRGKALIDVCRDAPMPGPEAAEVLAPIAHSWKILTKTLPEVLEGVDAGGGQRCLGQVGSEAGQQVPNCIPARVTNHSGEVPRLRGLLGSFIIIKEGYHG